MLLWKRYRQRRVLGLIIRIWRLDFFENGAARCWLHALDKNDTVCYRENMKSTFLRGLSFLCFMTALSGSVLVPQNGLIQFDGYVVGPVVDKNDSRLIIRVERVCDSAGYNRTPPSAVLGRDIVAERSTNPAWAKTIGSQISNTTVGGRIKARLEWSGSRNTLTVISLSAFADTPPFAPRIADEIAISVNGIVVPVYDFFPRTNLQQYRIPVMRMPLAVFAFASATQVVIDTDEEITNVVVRPLSVGITAVREGKRARFLMAKPASLCVEINNNIQRPIFIFGHAPKRPIASSPTVRVFGPGIHDADNIYCTSGETIYFADGAVVRGRIGCYGATNVAILGNGILVHEDWGDAPPILLHGSSNVRIEGLTVANPKDQWSVVLNTSVDVTVKGVNILSMRRDGLDVNGSSSVAISDSLIVACDDAFAIKSTSYGGVNGAPVSNIRLTDSTILNWGFGRAVEIGLELHARSIEDIRLQNIDIIRSTRGGSYQGLTEKQKQNIAEIPFYADAAISIDVTDHAWVRNVRFENIRIEECTDPALFIARVIPSPYVFGTKERGRISDIAFDSISLLSAPVPPSFVYGHDGDHRVESIVFSGITLAGKTVSSAIDLSLYTN